MKKIVVYGTGDYYKKNKHNCPKDVEIVAYADSNEYKSTKNTGDFYEGKKIVSPLEIKDIEYDYILIATDSSNAADIYFNLLEHGIESDKIQFLYRMNSTNVEWRYEFEPDGSIISQIGNVKIKERDRSNFDVVQEVFVSNAYNVNLPKKDTVVIDIGMNIGSVSLYFAQKDYVSKVYGFEPFTDTYNYAVENFSLNTSDISGKIVPYNLGLIDKEEVREVCVNAEESGWRNIFCEDEGKRKTTILCKDAGTEINKILDENVGKQIILKVDTEGSEFLIFESLRRNGSLDRIDAVLLEYHGEPQAITELLDDKGFKYFVNGRKTFGMIYAVK